MKRLATLALLIWAAVPLRAQPADFLRCADVSFLDDVERGGAFAQADPLRQLRDAGINSVRLRLFHSPTALSDSLPAVLSLARRADALGLALVLDLHYSDTWADPSDQQMPDAWKSLTYDVLRDSVRQYSESVVRAFVDQATPPTVVQVGNETTGGMLWPTGRVGGAFDTPQQWQRLGGLLASGIDGVRAASPGSEIVLHVHDGGDPATVRWWFDHVRDEGVAFDVIGLSYYPWWHGSLGELEATTSDAAERYQKPVFVAETAYPWTLNWFDDTNNIVGLPAQVQDGFAATPQGQAAFLSRVVSAVADLPRARGRGVCYWAPDWIAAPSFGSAWENLALFDDDGALLPAASALGQARTTATEPRRLLDAQVAIYPTPATDFARIRLPQQGGCSRIVVSDLLGRERLSIDSCSREALIDTQRLESGVYGVEVRQQDRRAERTTLIVTRR